VSPSARAHCERGKSFDWEFKRQLEGSKKGAFHFARALLGKLLSEDPEGHGEEGSGDVHHPMGYYSPGTLRDSCKGALETGHLSLWELCLGEPEGRGGAPLLVVLKLTKGKLWGWASLTMGA
jgi:hypothetical protein